MLRNRRTFIRAALSATLALGVLVSPAAAAERTLEGTLVCAKCTLKKADAADCQDVLLVAAANGATTEYYITKNEVAEKSGEVCTLKIKARVTGTVSQKDGRAWLTPSKIDKQIEKK